MSSELGRWALAYARKGWAVIPITPGRKAHPPDKWTEKATSDPATIRHWWTERPTANIALACGASGLVAIDLDCKGEVDGLSTWADLGQGFETLRSQTPSGGLHLIYRANGAKIHNSVQRLGPGVDVRAGNGYILLPPSQLEGVGSYQWDHGPMDGDPADLPEDLLAMLVEPERPPDAQPVAVVNAVTYGRRALAKELAILRAAQKGGRNVQLNLSAFAMGQLVGGGMLERSEVEAALLDAAMAIGLGERESMRTIKSGLDDGEKQPRQAPSRAVSQDTQAEPPGAQPDPVAYPESQSANTPTEVELVPALPEGAQPDPALGIGAGRWIDLFTDYASGISPMTPKSFHESAALWLGAVAIARRLKLAMPFGDVYPNLFILWLAKTTLYRKSTALQVARKLARDLYPHLLASQETTPEAFLADLAGREPTALQERDRAGWMARRDFAAQRGWVLDEMSGLLAGAGRDYNAGLVEALLRFYDNDPYYERSTRGQGLLIVRNACLSLLGASTPAAMAAHISAERLWAMGWWSRFAVLTPTDDPLVWREARETELPPGLFGTLEELHNRLPAPKWPAPPEARTAALGEGVHAALERYHKAVSFDLLQDTDIDQRLAGTYGRLPVQSLKVALILAAMDGWTGNAPTVELPHLARAIDIMEQWRASAHRALATGQREELDRLQERILRHAARFMPDGATLRDLYRCMQDKTRLELEMALDDMISLQMIQSVEYQHPKGGPKTIRYRLVTE